MTAVRSDEARAVPDLLYSDIEDDVRSSVRKLIEDRSNWHAVLGRSETDDPTDHNLWRALVDLGLVGLAVPEPSGGAGATWRETATVLEELGRGVAAVPFLGSAVTATSFALAAGLTDLVAELATGRATVVLAVPFAAAEFAGVHSGRHSDAIVARIPSVADALAADTLLVPLSGGEVIRVATGAPGVKIAGRVSIDMTRPLADVELDLRREDVEIVTTARDTSRALAAAAAITQAMLASEQLGLAEWCLDTAVAYLKERRQFGRTLGSYQALKHRCADLWVEITEARAVARYAAGCAATGDADLPIAASLAQALCSEVAVHAAEECVQLHGGIGFTWESPVHLRLKRAKAAALALGGADEHRSRLASQVDLPLTSATKESV